jgi:hypothetical protein
MKSVKYDLDSIQFTSNTECDGDFIETPGTGEYIISFKNLSRREEDEFYEDMEEKFNIEPDKYRKYVGFEVKMKRKMATHIMKYYLPAAGIELLSQ